MVELLPPPTVELGQLNQKWPPAYTQSLCLLQQVCVLSAKLDHALEYEVGGFLYFYLFIYLFIFATSIVTFCPQNQKSQANYCLLYLFFSKFGHLRVWCGGRAGPRAWKAHIANYIFQLKFEKILTLTPHPAPNKHQVCHLLEMLSWLRLLLAAPRERLACETYFLLNPAWRSPTPNLFSFPQRTDPCKIEPVGTSSELCCNKAGVVSKLITYLKTMVWQLWYFWMKLLSWVIHEMTECSADVKVPPVDV